MEIHCGPIYALPRLLQRSREIGRHRLDLLGKAGKCASERRGRTNPCSREITAQLQLLLIVRKFSRGSFEAAHIRVHFLSWLPLPPNPRDLPDGRKQRRLRLWHLRPKVWCLEPETKGRQICYVPFRRWPCAQSGRHIAIPACYRTAASPRSALALKPAPRGQRGPPRQRGGEGPACGHE